MLEQAFIYISFFALVIGIFDFGQFLFLHQALVERARHAARWGAINGPNNTTAITNMVLYSQSTAPANTAPYLGLAAGNVSVSTTGTGDDYRLTLTITGYRYTSISPYLAGSFIARDVNVTVPLGLAN